MNVFQREGRGIILATAIGVLSLFLAEYTPSAINSVMIALILGIALGNVITIPSSFESGVAYTSGKLLELSIIFLAFAINYSHIVKLGATSFIAVALVLFIILILSVVLAKKFNCPGSTGWLVGFGTAICGSSAIAALAPSVSKDKDDVAISMAVVNLYGTLGMIFLPMILLKTGLDTSEMGLMIGGSLHSVGNVAGAGYTVGEEAGEAAITIKLARVALLTPGLIFINFLINRKTAASWKDHFKLPWYLIGFIVITLIGTFVDFPESYLEIMESMGKVVLTIAMAAIGMKVSFKKLIRSGRKGLSFGFIMFLIQLALLAGFVHFIQ
jgi:uncharacterized integral membrane protein (TIGR00698 family)